MKFVIIGLVLLMHSIITTCNWAKVGKKAIEKFDKTKSFSWNRIIFYALFELIITTVFTTIVYDLSTNP